MFADNLAEKAPLDLAFDAHEHKDEIRISSGVPIIPLSMNFKKIVNVLLEIDDNGRLKNMNIKDIIPDKTKAAGVLADLYKNLFKDDIKKIYTLKSSDEKIKTLDIDGVRLGNSFLANFITDAVLYELKKEDNSIDFFALNSSAVRYPLSLSSSPSVSSMDIANVLSGIKEIDAQIMTTDLRGSNIAYMVLDNVITNSKNPEKNPLIHYAGLDIDKTGLLSAAEETDSAELCRYIKDKRTGQPILPDKIYRFANTEKYFNKSINIKIKKIKDVSVYTGFTVQELFKRYFETSNGVIQVNYDVRIY